MFGQLGWTFLSCPNSFVSLSTWKRGRQLRGHPVSSVFVMNPALNGLLSDNSPRGVSKQYTLMDNEAWNPSRGFLKEACPFHSGPGKRRSEMQIRSYITSLRPCLGESSFCSIVKRVNKQTNKSKSRFLDACIPITSTALCFPFFYTHFSTSV